MYTFKVIETLSGDQGYTISPLFPIQPHKETIEEITVDSKDLTEARQKAEKILEQRKYVLHAEGGFHPIYLYHLELNE